MVRVKALIRECTGCHRMTRPPRAKSADHPGTVLRRYGDKCCICHGRHAPEIIHAGQHEYNVAGLRSFLARRRDRENATLRRTYYEERMSA